MASKYAAYRREWRRQDKLKNPEKYKAAYLENKEKHATRAKMYYEQNKEAIKAKSKEWYENNKEQAVSRAKVYGRQYRERNKERWADKSKKWFAENPDKRVAYLAKRRAKYRTPKWVDAEETFLINEAYHLAQLRNKLFKFKWHVDHIIPLLGERVCGLHTIYNLQVIPAKINFAKNNRFEVL